MPPEPPRSDRRITAPRVFWPSLAIIATFVVLALALPEQMGELFSTLNNTVVGDLGWYYILVVSGFVLFSVWIAVSPMGRVVLGKDDEAPEFSLTAWFAMLFAAGMGIGLVFWGVAEPLNHFASPPPGTGETAAERARAATDATYLHWGLHAWAIYVVVGLAMAYAIHRKGRPVSIRWALEPLLGKRVQGGLGDAIDVIAVVGTLFGVATSLGFGVKQVGAGLAYLGVVGEVTTGLLVALVVAITAMATTSVVTGLDKGIKYLSNLNMGLAGVLMLLVLVLGPTVFLLGDFVSSVGSYLTNFFTLSFRTLSFQGDDGTSWLSGWTTFYWGWWMSWAPFVGVFIARISRGRTVREFVAGVLLVPTIVTFAWFAIFGGSGIHREIFGQGGLVGPDGAVDTDAALFQMLGGLPWSSLLSIVAIVLVVVFFVTSSDSGSFVVDMLASGGDPEPPTWSRVLWAVLEGAVAVALLVAGGDSGLTALQTAAILLALPFSLVMIGMVMSITRALLAEHGRTERAERRLLADEIAGQIARTPDLREKAYGNGNGTTDGLRATVPAATPDPSETRSVPTRE
ncbi:BCCT family transporter [Phycicoccus sp. MAQZ13P-2]|uniref:BCCT family transporter n=1 Tax=Phycicoccus mangrovi TaxID=2840470 RepID=UPI001C004F79|nr:BCCT family transporter [Phycicoccus mangrovi]MBT9256803.1 BCCT family transporter [Phycicoccus mangrovi]MBT9275048.1 BCCT family transporter [Phycicoccus mangrovi]